MVKALAQEGYGLAIGSRYVPGGGIANWPKRRIVTSRVAIALAQPLTPIRDITSGYFLVKREALDGVELDPIGFKIGLEVIAKARYGRALEVPYVFTDRVAGTSKLNQNEIFNYLKQLGRIYGARLEGQEVALAVPEWLRLRRAQPIPAEDAAQWTKCPKCGSMIYRPDLAANLWVCATCGHHFRMHAFDRISMLVDCGLHRDRRRAASRATRWAGSTRPPTRRSCSATARSPSSPRAWSAASPRSAATRWRWA